MTSIHLAFISLSGNTQSFVNRLTTYLQLNYPDTQVYQHDIKELIRQEQPFFQIKSPFVAFLPTYLEGGNGLDSGDKEILTTPLGDWIAFADNAQYCLGVVGSGNRNFNHQYCLTAKQYSQRFGFPVLDNFEMRGMDNDVKRIGQSIAKLYKLD